MCIAQDVRGARFERDESHQRWNPTIATSKIAQQAFQDVVQSLRLTPGQYFARAPIERERIFDRWYPPAVKGA
jgi:hypothetical protein